MAKKRKPSLHKVRHGRSSSAPAKITPPRLTENIYLRKRLFKELDNAFKKPVVWITALPGAGKTTLVSTYLVERRLPCIWYQIDEGDGDIASFFHYMGIAAEHAAPHYRKSLPKLTPEYLLGLPAFTRNFFRELYSRLNPASSKYNPSVSPFKKGGIISSITSFAKGGLGRIKKGGFALVLDNYQEAPADSHLHEIIQAGLSEIPEGINVIIISRIEPPDVFAGLRANNKIDIIGWNDLSLTTDETLGIARLKGIKKPTEEMIQQLHDRVNGWAAGIVLMLERQDSEELLQKSSGSFIPQAMFDYFASEIFYRLDKHSQEILLKTAFLPIINGRLAHQITGSHKAGELLAELNRRNYFTIRKSLPDPVYQYHPLFREFLLAQARHQLMPEQLVQTQQRAAEILDGTEQFEEAIILYRHTEDWQSMARIILANAQAIIAQGRYQAVEQWIKYLPQAIIAELPWLMYWFAVCRMPFNLPEARGHFEKAFERFKLQNDIAGIFLAWAGIVETYIYQWGDFKPLDKWIAEIEALLVKYPTMPSPEIEAKVTAGLFTVLMYRQPQHPDMPVWTERLQRLIVNSPDASSSMIMGNQLLLYYTWWSGDLAKGANLVNILEPLSRIQNLAPLSRIAWHAIKAAHCWMTADNRGCIQVVEEGLKIAEGTGVHIWDFMLLAQGIWSSLTSGDIAGGRFQLERMLSVMDNKRLLDVCHYRYLAFIEAMHRNDMSQMKEHAEAALRLAREAGVLWAEGVSLGAVARAYMASSRLNEVVEINKQAMKIAQDIKSKTIEVGVLTVKAEFAIIQGNETACLQALQKLFTFYKQHGFVNISSWRFSVMSRLCAFALEHSIETDYARYLIKARNLLPPEGETISDLWPFPLKLYTFGRFSALVGDKPIKFTTKTQKKPIELLKALISLGGREILEEQITDILWPESVGDAAHSAFTTTMQRLRKLIGNEDAILIREGKITINPQYCYVDSWSFERQIGEADGLWKENKQAEAIQIYEKAIKTYKGNYLKEDRQPYTLSMREKLKGKLIRFLIKLGRHYEEAGSMKKAVELYQKGLEIDDLCEEIYQQIMLCCRHLGLKAEAITAYNRCCSAMSTVLNTQPSAKTKEIYCQIMEKEKI